jgi:hypothetical protein
MTPLETDHSIAIIAYPDVQMSAVLSLRGLLMIANRHSQQYGGSQLKATEVSKQTQGGALHSAARQNTRFRLG